MNYVVFCFQCLLKSGVFGPKTEVKFQIIGKFPCKAAGRNKKSDEKPAAPGVKVIAVFSVTGLCMFEMEVTEGVADERQHTFTEKHRRDCLIGDRGYVDENLEQRLEEGGVMFIIKGRKNIVSGTIAEMYDEQVLKEYIGKKYGDIKERTDKWLDVIVACKDGRKVSIVREVNQNPVSTRRAVNALE